MDTSTVLSEIVARSAWLAERASACYRPANGPAPPATRAARLARWREAAARGDDARFALRLSWLGRTTADASALLGDVALADIGWMPRWAAFLGRCVAEYAVRMPAPAEGEPPEREGVPFGVALAPLVELAEAEMALAAGAALAQLAPGARADVRRQLFQRLSRLSAPVLLPAFDGFRRRTGVPSPAGDAESPGRGMYHAFLAELRAGAFPHMLREYSVLARLLASTCLAWAETTAELARRAATDAGSLGAFFGGGSVPGRVARLEGNLSDSHDGGRTVAILTFESGLRVVYKPRCLALDCALARLLAWLEREGSAPTPRVPRSLDRGAYGWQEHVRPSPCRNEAEVRTFYARTGGLLALAHALGGLDLHCENVVAAGGHPVVVDLETMLQPRPRRGQAAPARSQPERWVAERSVVRTGLLPLWQPAPDGGAYDGSGLGGEAGQETPFTGARWRHVNTDDMAATMERLPLPARPNRPMLSGTPCSAADNLGAVLDGFRAMYRLLRTRRDELLAPRGPLAALQGKPVRALIRPTPAYEMILQRSLRPECLRDGIDRSLRIELLARGVLANPGLGYEPLLPAEVDALDRLDIPRFTLSAGSRTLPAGDAAAPDCFEASAWEHMLARLRMLSERDLRVQCQLIRTAFGLRFSPPPPERAGAGSEAARARPHARGARRPLEEASPRSSLEGAGCVVDRLNRMAVRVRDGGVSWFALEPVGASARHRPRDMGPGLYAGTAGVALFLATYARLSGDARAARLAGAALREVRAGVGKGDAAALGLGLADGAGGAVYALARCADELQDDALLQDAVRAAHGVTAGAVADDARFDLLHGCAGAILGLVALYELRAEDWILHRAGLCARHLLTHRAEARTRGRTWLVGGVAPTGLAHGAAGMALALAAFHRLTGDAECRQAALDAVEYEDSLFSPEAASWPDIRPGRAAAPGSHASWCHGAPGMVLARTAMLPLDPALMGRFVRTTLDRLAAEDDATRPDHYCCGGAGLADALLACAGALGDPAMLEKARLVAAGIVARGSSPSGFRFVPGAGAGVVNAALFQGLAGIGYLLLRLEAPDRVPPLLLTRTVPPAP